MIIQNNKVSFEKEDWNSGLAKDAIELFKRNKCQYSSLTKKWTIDDKTVVSLDGLKKVSEASKEIDDLESTFGTNKQNKVSDSGLVSLYIRLKEIDSLLQELSIRKASDEIIDKYSKIFDDLNNEFNRIIK